MHKPKYLIEKAFEWAFVAIVVGIGSAVVVGAWRIALS